MKTAKFSHKTPHLKGKQHQLDPNLDLKQLIHHSAIEFVDRDADGDVDVFDNPKKKTPDENPTGVDVETKSKKLLAKQKGEIKHTKVGMAYYEDYQTMNEHCGCEDEAIEELEIGLKKLSDISYDSIDKLMRRIMEKHDMTAKQLHNAFVDKHNKTPDDWIKSMKEDYESLGEAGSLHHWFGGSKSKDGKPGWVQADGSPCANEPGETKSPKCFSSARLAALRRKGKKGESIIKSAVRRKRQEDPGQQQKSGAAKPTNVPTFAKGRKSKDYVKPEPGLKETMEIKEAQKDKPGKGSGTKDACYHKVKSRYSVWPSAYASGALVKCRKVGADNWGTKSEAVEEQRYCPLCDKRETRSECSYGGKAWDKVSIKDHEYSMARSELKTIVDAVKRLQMKVGKGEGDLEAWVQSKITKAADYIDTAADYVASGEMEESVGFTIDTSAHKTARRREKIRTLATKGVGGEKDVATKKLGATPELPKVKEETLVDKIAGEIVVEKCWPGYKKKGMKTMFGKRYPNCVKAEDVTIEDADGNTFAEVVNLIQPEPIKGFKCQIEEATRLQSQYGNIVAVTIMWRGKYYAMRMFFPQAKLPSRQDVTDEIQKVYPGAKLVLHSVSEFTPGQPLIQAGLQGGSLASPGPSKKYVKPYGEEVEYEEIEEDWQSVNRKDRTAGLSKAAVAAYRRENPGSKLQTAVTEKNPEGKRAKRRASFCRRMKGMKSKLTSAKTARDPDSNINKALRRWNCN